MNKTPLNLAISAILISGFALTSPSALAATVSVTGTDGDSLFLPGGDANATLAPPITNPDPNNLASAQGGAGFGLNTSNIGSFSQPGGNGGLANASVTSIHTSPLSTAGDHAEALGGAGGGGSLNANGGVGGSATAYSDTTNDGGITTYPFAFPPQTPILGFEHAIAVGGRGGDAHAGYYDTDQGTFLNTADGGAGGQAQSTTYAHNYAADGAGVFVAATSRSVGGQGGDVGPNGAIVPGLGLDSGNGGKGGDAHTNTIAIAHGQFNHVVLNTNATAYGGKGGSGAGTGHKGGDGGVALAFALSTAADGVDSFGDGSVTASIVQTGGDGGEGFSGADGGKGADSIIGFGQVNAKSDGGDISLSQAAFAGNGGSSSGGNGGQAGNADSVLFNPNAGGNIIGWSSATGGAGGGSTNGIAADGGSAASDVNLTSILNVDVFSSVAGGMGGEGRGITNAGNGGGLLGLHGAGSSLDGGSVFVQVEGIGGIGGASFGSGKAGDGAAVTLFDAAAGDTSGALALSQKATGGSAGTQFGSGLNGVAGNASSSLSKTSTNSSSLDVSSTAQGGDGGGRYSAGAASDGAMGDASAFANNHAGSASSHALATGGTGGSGENGADAGKGGNATANSVAGTLGDFHAVTVTGEATGGAGGQNGMFSVGTGNGGVGGDAVSLSLGAANGNSQVNVTDTATGGDGGSAHSIFAVNSGTGGKGGNAISTATGSNVGFDDVRVSSKVTGGRGGDGAGTGYKGGDGGGASNGPVSGVSNGTGYVNVSAWQTGGDGGDGFEGADGGAGGDAGLSDVTQGSTGGTLDLQQIATGGDGGNSNGGIAGTAGNAVSRLNTFNPQNGNPFGYVQGVSVANGGIGGTGYGGSHGRQGGTGTAQIMLTDTPGSTRDLSAFAIAEGGEGGGSNGSGDAGNGGLAVLLGARADASSGASVTAEGYAYGGRGGAAGGAGRAGDGAAVSLSNLVDGNTSGVLELTQNAGGGHAGFSGSGLNGLAGSAYSGLSKTASSATLILHSQAGGGSGGSQSMAGVTAANGAEGVARASAENSGNAYSYTQARGGSGGTAYSGAHGGNGGNALANNYAKSTGENSAAYASGSARGGMGGLAIPVGVQGNAGHGGAADSLSQGEATRNAQISVTDTAEGGQGGTVDPNAAGATGNGGNGGAAHSRAVGTGLNSGFVSVASTANGGAGTAGLGVASTSGRGGDARADASATGSGWSAATATAHGGGSASHGGSADAIATSTGSTGYAQSIANSGRSAGSLSLDVQGTATASLGGLGATLASRAQTAYTGPAFSSDDALARQAAAFFTADASGVTTPAGFTRVFGQGLLGGRAAGASGGGFEDFDSQLGMSVDRVALGAPEHLLVHILDTHGIGAFNGANNDFEDDWLRLSFNVDGGADERSFDFGIADGVALAGSTLDLGLWDAAAPFNLNLAFGLSVHNNDDANYAFSFVVGTGEVAPVPVPAAGWLLGSGLMGLLAMAKRRRNLS